MHLQEVTMGRCNAANIPAPSNIRLVVLGDRNVGKSALVVRFLTKRYIGEYASGTELTYQKEVDITGNKITAEICDALIKKDSQNYLRKLSGNTEACILVYNVCSRTSFEYACKLAHEVKTCHLKSPAGSDVPLLLVGNKSDLGHFREVEQNEGESFAKSIRMCRFVETSAAESFSDVERAFQLIFQLVRANFYRASPTPSVTSTRINRKNSWSHVAHLIREHVRKQHGVTDQNLQMNQNDKEQATPCNDNCVYDKNNNATRGILTKRRMRKNSSLGFAPNAKPFVEKLKSRCLSLTTLNENSHANGAKHQKYHPYSSTLKLPTGDSRKSSETESSIVKMSLSSDETLELSDDFSTPDEDAFLPEDPNHSAFRFTKTTPLRPVTQLMKRDAVKPSINKKNLKIRIYSDENLDKTDDKTLQEYRENVPPKSAPALRSSSNKFRFFPSGPVEDKDTLTNSQRPVETPNFGENCTKSPKDEKRSPAHQFLKHFFRGSSSTNRTFGSSQNLAVPASHSKPDVYMTSHNENARSTLTSIAEDKHPGVSLYEHSRCHVTSGSLSSVLTNDDLDTDNMDSCFSDPSSPVATKVAPTKTKLPSFRGAVEGLMMRKRKQSASGDITIHGKERFFC